jgi:hypothetical protein
VQAVAMWGTLYIPGMSHACSITMPAGGCKQYELFTTACFVESVAVQETRNAESH